MRRYCFTLQVRPELLDEYRRRHAAVSPDMLTALRDAGWHDYSLFLRDDGLVVGYLMAADFTAAQAAVAATEASATWEAAMAGFFVDGRADEHKHVLTEVFNLDDQLGKISGEAP